MLECTKNHFINANRSIDVGGFANDCRKNNKERGECEGNNSKFVFNSKLKNVKMVATRMIPPRTEVCVPYGTDYWRKYNTEEEETRNKGRKERTRDKNESAMKRPNAS